MLVRRAARERQVVSEVGPDIPRVMRGRRRGDDRLCTAANVITLTRVLALPVFVCLVIVGAWVPASAVMVLVAASDGADGFVARRFDQVSHFGAIADRVADRAAILTASCTLGLARLLPWWLAGPIVGRDVALFAVLAYAFHGPMPGSVTRTGKWATAFLLVGLPAFLVERTGIRHSGPAEVGGLALTVVGIALYYASALQYVWVARSHVGRRPPAAANGSSAVPPGGSVERP